jgi:hypothetical protein
MLEDIWLYLVFGASILAFGIYRIWSAYKTYKNIVASKEWPVTKGEVTAAKINQEWWWGKGGIYYRPKITYRYSVLGNEQTKRVRLESTKSEEEAKEVLEMLPLGIDITVSYNPENPKDCVSEYDEESIPWLGLGAITFGIMIILIAFLGDTTTGQIHH